MPLGFVFAAVFLWLARPNLRTMAMSLVLVVPGLWLRAYASGYVKKNAELTMTGPYAHTRNPLYLGSMLIAFGFAAASWRWEILVALAVLFAVIYVPTILSEEEYLRGQFPGFDAYARAVPRLLPRLTAARPTVQEAAGNTTFASGGGSFSGELYRKHREYNSLIGACALYLALALKWMHLQHMF